MTDLALANAAAAGDFWAWDRLCRSVSARLLGTIRACLREADGRGSGPVDADDVLQETLLAAWKSIPGREFPNEKALLGWLRTVARNKARDAGRADRAHARHVEVYRRRCRVAGRVVMGEVTEDAPAGRHDARDARRIWRANRTPSRLLSRRQSLAALRRHLDDLSAIDAEVVERRHFDGQSWDEIGRAVGVTAEAARKRNTRALDALRAAYEERTGDPCPWELG